MKLTPVLCEAKKRLKSLALSVYFKQLELGMKDHEILSRATAYLLAVDAKDPLSDSKFPHLELAERKRNERVYKDAYGRTQAGGPAGRDIMDLSWLEFVPCEVRPTVHVVCSAHVVSPFAWRDYYPLDWLSKVREEHCSYSLDVYDPEKPDQSLAKLPLNSHPFPHPEGRDIAVLHFREEASSLRILQKLGVEQLYLRDPERAYEEGETMYFDGFMVKEQDVPVSEKLEKDDKANEDTRVFHPYKDTGKLAFLISDRLLATTPAPLPEGLCGAPAIDAEGDLCGTVDGIVPVTHKNSKLAGCAAVIPSYIMKAFIDHVERDMVKAMMPDDLFSIVETCKKTNSVGGGVFKMEDDGKHTGETTWEEEYTKAQAILKKKYTPEEYQTIMSVVEKERDDVLTILDKEGGDIDKIIDRVRAKTMEIKALVQGQYSKLMLEKGKITPEDEERILQMTKEKEAGALASEGSSSDEDDSDDNSDDEGHSEDSDDDEEGGGGKDEPGRRKKFDS
jgi:hypothetical protein